MNLGHVIGTIWATRKDENLAGAKMQLLQPIDHHNKNVGEPIVAIDTIGAGPGETVFYITAREAVLPYFRPMAPIDASIVGIVDTIENYT